MIRWHALQLHGALKKNHQDKGGRPSFLEGLITALRWVVCVVSFPQKLTLRRRTLDHWEDWEDDPFFFWGQKAYF